MTEDAVTDYIIWPLKRGETLSNHDWFPFHGHEFLGSKLVSECVMGNRRDIGFSAVVLWAEAMRQNPAGTLPTSDIELACLAKFPSIEGWKESRDLILDGWVTVHVEDKASDKIIQRLGHPQFLEPIVEDMHRRKKSRDAGREAQKYATHKFRMKKKMYEIQVAKHIIDDDRIVHQMLEFFKVNDLPITHDNVRVAMMEILGFAGNVEPLKPRKAK